MSNSNALTVIRSKGLSAAIDPLGAQLYALQDVEKRALLWDGDPTVWSGRAPLLFPIVGTLVDDTYRLASSVYHLARHGFARKRIFSLVDATLSSALFRLRWDEATMQVYPFRFDLDVQFSVEDSTLTIATSVKNLGANDMPASFGFHPAFRWPLPYGEPRSAHSIVFESDEPAPIRRVCREGTVIAAAVPTPVTGRVLGLRDELFVDDAIIFDRIASHRLWYGAPSGPRLRVDYPDTPYLGIWTKPGAQFICIEPWHGFADPQGFSGDFRTKPGVFLVAPGEEKQCSMSITLCNTP
jgi:galactose mutarotase-like enzyme